MVIVDESEWNWMKVGDGWLYVTGWGGGGLLNQLMQSGICRAKDRKVVKKNN